MDAKEKKYKLIEKRLGKVNESVYNTFSCGEVAEWSKAIDSKSIGRLAVPWVQIPPSPPNKKFFGSGKLEKLWYNTCR